MTTENKPPVQLAHSRAAHVHDGKVIFQIPKRYLKAILAAVPALQMSFHDLQEPNDPDDEPAKKPFASNRMPRYKETE